MGPTMHAVAAESPQSTLRGTPTCLTNNGTALYETYPVCQEESGCIILKIIGQMVRYTTS